MFKLHIRNQIKKKKKPESANWEKLTRQASRWLNFNPVILFSSPCFSSRLWRASSPGGTCRKFSVTLLLLFPFLSLLPSPSQTSLMSCLRHVVENVWRGAHREEEIGRLCTRPASSFWAPLLIHKLDVQACPAAQLYASVICPPVDYCCHQLWPIKCLAAN